MTSDVKAAGCWGMSTAVNHIQQSNNTIDAFVLEMEKNGLFLKETVVCDGKIHRFYIKGDKLGSLNGWYVLYGGAFLAGAFGSWKDDVSFSWSAVKTSEMSFSDRKAFQTRMEEARRQSEIETKERQEAAAKEAVLTWSKSKPATEHAYLKTKGVKAYGIRQTGDLLLIPLYDTDKTLWNIQTISANGTKLFMKGGRKKGCYCPIGVIHSNILCIAEGYATAATIHETTGSAVAVAFDMGNLKPVAQALRLKHPNLDLFICADNDDDLGKGILKATEAALTVNGQVIIPNFTKAGAA